jgi:hypothetical protein
MSDPAEEEADYRAHASGSALELASTAFLASEVDLSGDLADFTLTYALDVRSYLEALQSAVREARKQLDSFIAAKLEGVQYYRHRDQIVKVGGSGTWKVREEAVNNGALAGFIGKEWPQVVNLKAQGAVTKTRLHEHAKNLVREIPDEIEDAEQWLDEVGDHFIQPFFDYKTNDDAISVMPADRAPKKAQALPDGGKIERKSRLEERK